jgi:TetR/AcrR family transcriptional regulator, mexJK operon transcriptional repressor
MKSQFKSKRMGRPPSQQKREAILKAAGDVFMEFGFAGSVDRIAELAGVSKQTVYGHFASKENLYREAGTVTLRAPVDSMIDQRLPLEDALRAYGIQTLKRLLSNSLVTVHRRLIEQAATFPAMAAVHAEFGPGLSLKALSDYFEVQMSAGVLRVADPHLAAGDFLALLQGMWRLDRLFGHTARPKTAALERHVLHAVDIFLRAYRADDLREGLPSSSSRREVPKARKRTPRPLGGGGG